MSLRVSVILAFVAIVISTPDSYAASLGKEFDSYRDMHRDTQYGSLFLNKGAIRYRDNRSKKRFVEITGSGQVNLPLQAGYCFVFNHYFDSPDGSSSKQQKFRLKISKTFDDGRVTSESLEREFEPASSMTSSNLPDWCISGIAAVLKVALEFSSEDSALDRAIWFEIKR